MDPLQVYVLTVCIAFIAYGCGALWTEVKHEAKGKSRFTRIKIFFNYFFE
jgi:hypothetical protein